MADTRDKVGRAGVFLAGVGKTLEQKGLIKDALAFTIQERMSAYHGQIKAGTYLLSTAYTPTRIIAVLSGEESKEGSNSQ